LATTSGRELVRRVKCSIEGCEKKHLAKGLCGTHYARQWRRGGDPRINLNRRRSLADRFWEKVKKTDGCWEWTARRLPKGYGTISCVDHRTSLCAHRVSWELHNGPIPDGMWVLHHCDNPQCANPDHLFLGTHTQNMRDMLAKGRGRWRQAKRGSA
jgi:HNH endonuclease